jgi:hypothetical protein
MLKIYGFTSRYFPQPQPGIKKGWLCKVAYTVKDLGL